jgi:uncharacterized membrane protein
LLYRWIFLAFILVGGLPALADDNGDANALFVEAVKAWEQAAAIIGEDVEEVRVRLELLEMVSTNLNAIVDEHPGSDLAVQLIIGANVGPLSINSAQAAIEDASNEVIALACKANPSKSCVLNMALETARDIEDENLRTSAFGNTATELANAGMFERALTAAREIEDDFYRALALGDIVFAMVGAGMVERAFETVGEIQNDDRVRVSDYRTRVIATAMAEEGMLDRALETARGIEDKDYRVRRRKPRLGFL